MWVLTVCMSLDLLPHPPDPPFFFTVQLLDRRSDALVRHVDVLRQAMRIARKAHPFEIRAAVVLPAVAHMIWTLPRGDQDHALRWRIIKATFSRHVPAPDDPDQCEARPIRREKGIWRRGYKAHQIRDQRDYDLHEHLICHAPVAAGLVRQPRDWALSSLHVRGAGRSALFAPPPMDTGKLLSADATLF